MYKINFQNLEKSELAVSSVQERLQPVVDRFPDLKSSHIQVTLSMDNSPVQAGPDLFKVRLRVNAGPYRGVILQKEAPNLYVALSDVVEKLHERVRRHSEKQRRVRRNQKRTHKKQVLNQDISDLPVTA